MMARKLGFIGLVLLVVPLTLTGLAACGRRGENKVEAAPENVPGDQRSTLTQADKTFLDAAVKANMQERLLGRLALERTQNPQVKEYAQMMIDDHNHALKDLVHLMQQKGMNQPSTLPEAHSEALDQFKGLTGSAFDKKFVDLTIQEHEKAIDMFKHEATAAQDNDVRKYASDMLPMLEKHMQKAMQLQQEGV
jgi:putative membrane protein